MQLLEAPTQVLLHIRKHIQLLLDLLLDLDGMKEYVIPT